MTHRPKNSSGFVLSGVTLNHRTVLFLILLMGLLLRLFDLLNATVIEMDGIGYTAMAGNFMKGQVFEALKDISHPLYPLFLAFFGFLIKDLELAGRLLSLACGVLLIYISFAFVRRFFDENKALWASFFVAIHPYLIRFSAQVLTESLAILLFTAAVFLFFKGWVDDDFRSVGLSAILLAMTYLTKAEYVIYAAPFSFLLLQKKRYSHAVLFLALLLIFCFPYIYYIKMETGIWTITKKVGMSENIVSPGKVSYTYAAPFASMVDLLGRAPFVVYNFFLAVFPPFFILAVLGLRRMDSSYRKLTLILVAFHLLGRTVGLRHSTLRYSVEFVPIVLIYCVEGLPAFRDMLGKYKPGRTLYYGALAALIAFSIGKGLTTLQKGREIHKYAGTFLSKLGPDKRIAEAFPVATYYAGGKWVNIDLFYDYRNDCNTMIAKMKEKGVDYFIFDYRMSERYPSVESCLSTRTAFAEFRENGRSVKIYRLSDQ
jgi:hypothetical protein